MDHSPQQNDDHVAQSTTNQQQQHYNTPENFCLCCGCGCGYCAIHRKTCQSDGSQQCRQQCLQSYRQRCKDLATCCVDLLCVVLMGEDGGGGGGGDGDGNNNDEGGCYCDSDQGYGCIVESCCGGIESGHGCPGCCCCCCCFSSSARKLKSANKFRRIVPRCHYQGMGLYHYAKSDKEDEVCCLCSVAACPCGTVEVPVTANCHGCHCYPHKGIGSRSLSELTRMNMEQHHRHTVHQEPSENVKDNQKNGNDEDVVLACTMIDQYKNLLIVVKAQEMQR